MKRVLLKLIYIVIFYFNLLGISVAQTNSDLLKIVTINNLGANGTQAKRYEIAKIGYNSVHWQEGGLIEIELRQKYFGTNYEKYIIELGYGQGTGTTSPRLRSMESSGSYRNAKVTLGVPVAMGTSYANEPNLILPVYIDVKNYTNYFVQIRFIRNRVETLNSFNQIYINENPSGLNIPDFTIDKGAEAVFISREGNFGLWNQSPSRKLHVGNTLPGTSSDPEADIVSSSGIMISTGKMLSFDQNYFTHASIKYSTAVANESRMIFQGYYGHAFTTRGDIPRMVINGESGNVGIGTTTPDRKLVINGELAFDYGDTKSYNGLKRNYVATEYFNIITSSPNNIIHRFTGSAGVDKLVLLEGGNVGIGTSAPNETLEIGKNGRAFFGNGAGSARKGLLISGSDPNINYARIESYSYGTTSGIPLVINPAGGQVSIGTTTPFLDYKLSIAGNVVADKVKVKKSTNGTWPDFVFKKDYHLPSLSEIEKYVNENSHLPEIPSAAEVEKDGQDLGEMNRLLLKKVEELTLYLIEQNKQIEKQSKDISELKSLIKK